MREPNLRRVLAAITVTATVAAGLIATTATAAQAAKRPDPGRAPAGLSATALSAQQLAKRDVFAKRTGEVRRRAERTMAPHQRT